MAARYGVSQQAWGQWETGKKTPVVVTMKKLEFDSGIPMEELFFDVFNNQKLRKDA
jgi:transcriptional regulator with XRE-family HTH domain